MASIHKKMLVIALLLISILAFAASLPEVEPNNTQATAQTIVLGDSLRGKITNFQDIDYFKLDLAAGAYQLSIFYPGGEPQNRDWFELLTATGAKIPSICFYPGSGVHLSQFKLCTAQTIYMKALPNTDLGLSGADYSFLFQADNGTEQECNDTPASAKVMNQPGEVLGKINLNGDVDWLMLKDVKAGLLSVAINAAGSTIPFSINLYGNVNAVPIAANNPGRNELNTSLPANGTYYLQIKYPSDTSSSFSYKLAALFTPRIDTPCIQPAIGVIRNRIQGKKVKVETLINQADSIVVSWGDGTTSDSLTHEYANNGNYTISLKAINSCSTAIAETKVTILTASFELGKIKNALLGSIVKVPLISKDGEFPAVGITGTVKLENPIAEWIGFESGTLETRNITSNFANGQFAGVFSPKGDETTTIGDTLLYVVFRINPNAKPGDSTTVDLNGGTLVFSFSGFLNGETFDVPSTLIPGSITVIKNIKFSLNVRTPDGQPFPFANVKISGTGASQNFQTDRMGMLQTEFVYRDNFEVTVFKDTLFFSGLSPVDVFLINRTIVGLLNPGLSKYAIFSGDVNCDGKLTVIDGVIILQRLVGLAGSNTPCGTSVKFIPSNYTFPPYPSTSYFQAPNSILINNPDPNQELKLTFDVVILGDLNNSWTYAGAKPEVEPELHLWQTTELQNNKDLLQIKLSNDGEIIQGGVLGFEFDATQFLFQNAEIDGHQMVTNTKEASLGKIKLAFARLGATNQSPEIVLTFKKKHQLNNFQSLKLNTTPSLIVDKNGQNHYTGLERQLSPNTHKQIAKVFPNPAVDLIKVNCLRNEGTIYLQNALGKTVFTTQYVRGITEIPVRNLASGTYFLRIDNQVEKIQILH